MPHPQGPQQAISCQDPTAIDSTAVIFNVTLQTQNKESIRGAAASAVDRINRYLMKVHKSACVEIPVYPKSDFGDLFGDHLIAMSVGKDAISRGSGPRLAKLGDTVCAARAGASVIVMQVLWLSCARG